MANTFRLANGVEIPVISFGTWQVPEGKTAISSVAHALKLGYPSVDTAAAYQNEEGVGQGIRESGIDRKNIFVTTKLWNADHGYDKTLAAFDKSMKKLGLEVLDLYLIHWPGRNLYVDTWKAFERLYEEKRVRAIGVSNFLTHHLQELAAKTNIAPMVNQIETHPYFAQQDTEDYCHKNNIQIEAWSPLMSGGEALRDKAILAVAQKHGKTPAQVILRWHIQMGRRVLPKSVTPARIEENLKVLDFTLDESDLKAISALQSHNQRTGPNPDNFFMAF